MVVLRRKLAVLLVAMAVVLALGSGLLGAVGSASPDNNADNRSDKGRSTLTVLTKTRELELPTWDHKASAKAICALSTLRSTTRAERRESDASTCSAS